MVLRATYPHGEVAQDETIPEMDWVSAAWKRPQPIVDCRGRMKPKGIIFLTINPGLVSSTALATSYEGQCYELAEALGLISPYKVMGFSAIWLNRPETKTYLYLTGRWLARASAEELDMVDGAIIDFTAWQWKDRAKLGVRADDYAAMQELMRAFQQGFKSIETDLMLGLNSYGDSLTQPDPLGLCTWWKAENFWALRSTRFGTGNERLWNMLHLLVSRLVNRQNVLFVVNPMDLLPVGKPVDLPDEALDEERDWKEGWTHEEQRMHMEACAGIFCGLARQWPDLLYWWCDRTFNGARIADPVNPELIFVTGMTWARDRVAITYENNHTYRVVCPDSFLEPLRLERVE